MSSAAASQARRINIPEVIDNSPVSTFQMRIALICFCVAVIEGFDTQAMGFVGPVIIKQFDVPPARMGAVFSASLFGLMLGASALSLLADRIGRKSVIILSCVITGVFALLTTTATSANELVGYRLLTGIGIGGTMPNLYAVTGEYSPARKRAFLTTAMFIGFPCGSMIGGFISPALIEAFGWSSVFFVGGVTPLALAFLLLYFLPESIRFLTLRDPGSQRIAEMLEKITAAYTRQAGDEFFLGDAAAGRKASPIALFADQRSVATILLWTTFFGSLLTMYVLMSWMPTILHARGFSLTTSIVSMSAFNGAGMVGGLVLAYAIDRLGPTHWVAVSFIGAGIFVAAIGQSGDSATVTLLFALLAGFCLTGNQFAINAYAVNYYPTFIRATGVGWCLAVGRIGAVVGPLVIGAVLALGWGQSTLFLISSLPMFLCAVTAYFYVRHIRR